VAQVIDGSPAQDAGIKGGTDQTSLQGQTYVVGGDVITAIDGEQVSSMEQLAGIVSQHAPSDEITVSVLRDGSTSELTVTLSERPQQY